MATCTKRVRAQWQVAGQFDKSRSHSYFILTMPKNIPVLECLNCNANWRCYKSKRKLTPSRNCPECYQRLKIEGQDYKWLDTGNFTNSGSTKYSTEITTTSQTKIKKRHHIDVMDLIT